MAKAETGEAPGADALATALQRQNELTARQVDIAERQVAIAERQEANAVPNEIGYGDPRYQQRLRDEGFMDAFHASVFQNGREAQPRGLPAATIARVAELRTGEHFIGPVRVTVIRDSHGRIFLQYKAAQIEDRMRFQQSVKSFEDLIDQLWAQQHKVTADAPAA